ncbi:MAG: hypothetical protein IPO85_08020 [Saprospiraceae bacterium]|uniref:Penicillin-binding protein transpeptidase domain-containing protein n=1 Tax=Candidatus Defluviibacterium haderslevense TaxID=2981993 RepID=A0A9D7XEB4_9BACT|nr:hypothetical protein [Candidatus Defluviibacterium haderslevense]
MNYIIRGKTGWGGHGDKDVGWYVGYIETKGQVYYFSNCVQTDSKTLNDVNRAILFDNSRIDIVYKILEELSLINE